MKFDQVSSGSMIACVMLLLATLAGHLLFSDWPGAMVGAGVLVILLCGAWGYEIIEGSVVHLKKPIIFILLLFVFWGMPFTFFFLDLLEWLRGNVYEVPQCALLLPLVSDFVFLTLYVAVCKAANENHALMNVDWLVVIAFFVFSTILFSSPILLYLYSFYADQYGKSIGGLICGVYSIYMLFARVRKLRWHLLKFYLPDVLVVLFYNIVFSTPFLVTLSFGFLVTFFGCNNEKKSHTTIIGMLFWHAILIVLPILAFLFRYDEYWRETFAFRENSLIALLIYEFFAVFYAVATVQREIWGPLRKVQFRMSSRVFYMAFIGLSIFDYTL